MKKVLIVCLLLLALGVGAFFAVRYALSGGTKTGGGSDDATTDSTTKDGSAPETASEAASETGKTPGQTAAGDDPGQSPEQTADGESEQTVQPGQTIPTYLRVNAEGEADANGEYVLFGEYPQTIIADGVKITTKRDDRGYYLGSDGAYYAERVAAPYSSGYIFSNGATVGSGTVYYFKVEPIKWRILTESDGVALILCEQIVDRRFFDDDSNNYGESTIRAWLNGQFYETAFTDLQRSFVQISTVDNGARSTSPSNKVWNSGVNENACADTEDAVFLLSELEVTTVDYGFAELSSVEDAARAKKTTDYGTASGVWVNNFPDSESAGHGRWWLRSPSYSNGATAQDVSSSGVSGYSHGVATEGIGVAPALRIRF